jgi:hypothetical protein
MRREFQRSEASTAVLARKYGVNPKTVAKWRRRKGVAELAKGPKRPVSTVLSADDEALIVAFRKLSRLPLDACWARLKPMIPTLRRSGLHRCLKRWRISRVPVGLRPIPPPVDFANDSGHFDLDPYRFAAHGGERYLLMATGLQRKVVFAKWAATLDAEFVATFIDALARSSPIAVQSIMAPASVFFAPTAYPEMAVKVGGKPSVFVGECRRRRIAPLPRPAGSPAPPRIVAGWSDVVAAQRRPRAKTRPPRRR